MKKFSICIPNFNYEKYLGRTLQSAVTQSYRDYEIVVADNASTDTSVAIVQEYAALHPNISYKVNACNVGFAGNLDESGRMASGEWMIMLSSDDLITQEALSDYNKLIGHVQQAQGNTSFVISSTFEKIGPDDEFIEYLGPANSSIWKLSDIDAALSAVMGCNVYKISCAELLSRCLPKFYNPFNFAATCYPAHAYQAVGGYSGSRMMNPDKWFHWKLMGQTDYAYIIDKPLFKYRWHPNNQTALLGRSGALKFWADEYRNSFEPEESMLKKAGLTRNQMSEAFILHMIKYIFQAIRQRDRFTAFRLFHYAYSCYPDVLKKNKYYWPLRVMLPLFPLSSLMMNMISTKIR